MGIFIKETKLEMRLYEDCSLKGRTVIYDSCPAYTCVFILIGETGFEPCYSEVLKVVQGKLHQPDEIQRSSFYAFSYYYDRAVDTDLIGE